MKKILVTLLATFVSASSLAASKSYDKMGSLGGNKDIIKKARELDPDNKVRVVQRRTVDRNWRLELGVNYGMIAGGDSYINTQNVGGNLDLHINPMWSVGARYYKHYNEFTSEGKRVWDDQAARANNGENFDGKAAVDFPLESTLGIVSFYPIYGKLNVFDMGVAQFDLYVLGGYGQVRLSSGTAPTWTAGGGAGLWLSQHFSSRIEVRYQNYKDEISSGSRDINAVVSTVSIGFIL